jgi:hypothetical protein
MTSATMKETEPSMVERTTFKTSTQSEDSDLVTNMI